MANRGKQSPLSDPAVPEAVREVIEGALEGSRGGVFPGALTGPGPGDLARLDPSALRDPMTEILTGRVPDMALVFLHGAGVLGALLPEVTAMVDFTDEYDRHKDLWTHTIRVVSQVQSTAVLRWAALLHDIGKVDTRSFDAEGKVHFFGHEVAGARMFKQIASRLGFPAGEAGRIRFLIRNHLRAGQYEDDWTDSAVRRFGREMGDGLDDLISLSRADITTKYERKRNHHLVMLDRLSARVADIRARDAVPQALPKGLGNALMSRFSLPPGPRLGLLMGELTRKVEAGELPRNGEHGAYVAYVEAHVELLGTPR